MLCCCTAVQWSLSTAATHLSSIPRIFSSPAVFLQHKSGININCICLKPEVYPNWQRKESCEVYLWLAAMRGTQVVCKWSGRIGLHGSNIFKQIKTFLTNYLLDKMYYPNQYLLKFQIISLISCPCLRICKNIPPCLPGLILPWARDPGGQTTRILMTGNMTWHR